MVTAEQSRSYAFFHMGGAMATLKRAQKEIEDAILCVPTSENRNKLTELNIEVQRLSNEMGQLVTKMAKDADEADAGTGTPD